jgi:hypothetical protein
MITRRKSNSKGNGKNLGKKGKCKSIDFEKNDGKKR